jgi:phage pi2 protein 07
VDEFIKKNDAEQGKTSQEIEKRLAQWTTIQLKQDIKRISGFEFYPSNKYDNWHDNAYDLRTEIVHHGKQISKEESKTALKAIQDTINFLKELSKVTIDLNVSLLRPFYLYHKTIS